MFFRALVLLLLSSLLLACGGGNGGRVSSSPLGSSSISSLSSSSIATCANTDGAIFIDEVCGAWQSPSFYEQNKITFAGGENTTGVGNNLNLTVISEEGHVSNKVIDIRYGLNDEYNATPRLLINSSYPNGIDLTEYANGSIQFDLKVIDAGVSNPRIQMILECGWPCASTFDIVEPGQLNQWKHIEIPVAHLIDRGLDISKVNTGFQIAPDWNKQNGFHLQIDNVRWVKNNVQQPRANICYANYLQDQQTSSTYVDISLVGNNVNMEHLGISNIYPTLIFTPKWNLSNTFSLHVGTTIDSTTFLPFDSSLISKCLNNSLLVFDLYIDKGYTSDFPLSFIIGFGGRNTPDITIPSAIISNNDFTPGQWNRIEIPVSISQDGLYQVVFNIMGPDTSESLGSIMIDNILIIKSTP